MSKPYHHGNLAAVLLEQATLLVEEEGAGALTLREVARRVGVSAPALYRHFADKDALLDAVAARAFARMAASFETHPTADVPPLDRLRALASAIVDYAVAHPRLHALMFGPDRSEAAGRSFRMLTEAVSACLPPDAPPERVGATSVAVWSLVHGYGALLRDGHLLAGRLDFGGTVERLVLGTCMQSP